MNATPRKTLHVFLPDGNTLIYLDTEYNWKLLDLDIIILHTNSDQEVAHFSQIPFAIYKDPMP